MLSGGFSLVFLLALISQYLKTYDISQMFKYKGDHEYVKNSLEWQQEREETRNR